MKRTFKPARKLRHEMISFSAVVSLPLFLAVLFPVKAFLKPFKPALPVAPATEFILVSLSMKQEKDFLALARSAWQSKGQTLSSTSLDVPMDLPEIEPGKLESRLTLDSSRRPPHEQYSFVFYPSTEALAAPMRLSPDTLQHEKKLPFSKKELTTLPE